MTKYYLMLMVGLLLQGCSSMKPEDDFSESLPSDFDVTVYAQINPDIGYAQMRPFIVALNKPRKDSIGLTAPEDSMARRIAKENWDADIAVFNADTLHIQYIITTFTGFPAENWDGTISTPMKGISSAYNIQGFNSAQERAYYDSFQVDTTLIAYQYYYYGQIEGRPYKYCEAGKFGALKDSVAPTVMSKQNYPDYRPNTFCKNQADKMVYLNL